MVVGFLDSCARLHLDRNGRFGSYFYLGLAGVLVGFVVIVTAGHLSGATTKAIVVGSPMLAFLVAVKLSHIIFGYERIVLYEKLGAALGGSALALHLAGEPVLAGLDLGVLGLGTFLVFGRLGCLHVGCCHGRPHRFGIIYGDQHARAGFTHYYVGVRLFPIQLLESVLTLGLVVASIAAYSRPHGPGEIVAGYLLGYAVVRFALELGRGDDDRPYLFGASEAQWIAVVSAVVIAAIALDAEHPRAVIALIIAAVLAVALLALAIAGRALRWRAWGWRHVNRIRELADAVARLRLERGTGVHVREVDGVRLSYSAAGEHYALSRTAGELDERAARVIAARLAALCGTAFEVRAGRTAGVFHLQPAGRNK